MLNLRQLSTWLDILYDKAQREVTVTSPHGHSKDTAVSVCLFKSLAYILSRPTLPSAGGDTYLQQNNTS